MGVKSGLTGPNGQNVRSVVGAGSPLGVAIAKVVSLVLVDVRAQPTTNPTAILISHWFKINFQKFNFKNKNFENFKKSRINKQIENHKSVRKSVGMTQKNQKSEIFQILFQNSNLVLL